MSRFASKHTVQIHDDSWEPHEVVIIKEKMSTSDERWIQDNLMWMQGVSQKDAKKDQMPPTHYALGTVKLKTLERMIVSWTFTNNNHSVPISPEAIEDLDRETSEFIYQEINKRNQPMTEDEQQRFLPSANGHIVESPLVVNS